jgi:hypothetical protein
MGHERRRADREPHGDEVEALLEWELARLLREVARHAAEGEDADEGEARDGAGHEHQGLEGVGDPAGVYEYRPGGPRR